MVIYELALEYKMAVWDMYEIMGGYGSSELWKENGLMPKDLYILRNMGIA